MCEGHPPHIEMHPMRAIFIIPTKPAPTLKNRSLWSAEFWNFTTRCLVKNPEERASSKELLEDKFILNAKGNEILLELIEDAGKILKNVQENNNALKLNKQNLIVDNKPDLTNCSTMISKVPYNNGSNLEIKDYEDGTLVDYGTNASFVDHNGGTTNYHQLQPDHTIIQQTTMDTSRRTSNIEFNGTPRPTSHLDNRTLYRNNYDAQTSKEYPMFNLNDSIEQELPESNSTNSCELNIYSNLEDDISKGFNYLKNMSNEWLINKKANLEKEMLNEIDDLRKRYLIKREPILAAIDLKKNNIGMK